MNEAHDCYQEFNSLRSNHLDGNSLHCQRASNDRNDARSFVWYPARKQGSDLVECLPHNGGFAIPNGIGGTEYFRRQSPFDSLHCIQENR